MTDERLRYVVSFGDVRITLSDEDTANELAEYIRAVRGGEVTVTEVLAQNIAPLPPAQELRAQMILRYFRRRHED